MSLRGKRRSNRWALSVLATRGHIRPQSVDFIRLEQVAPRRHGVLALRYRGEEALALIARELAQIRGAFRIGHARTVARGAVPRKADPEGAPDLRKFPRDQRERILTSVSKGKNSMPPWGDLLKPDEIEALWAYVATGGN